MRAAARWAWCRVDRIARRRHARLAVISATLAALALGLMVMPAAAPATPGTPSIGASQSSPLMVAFTGSPDGAVSYSWDFGDGSTGPEQNQQNPTHTYGARGDYTVSLTTSDLVPPDASTTRTVHVYDLPSADFGSGTAAGTLTVNFTDLSGGEPTGWSWDFGDGNGSPQKNPSHTYASPGDKTVRLTATNPAGSSTQTKTITVNPLAPPPPRSSFTAAPAPTAGPHAVAFTDTSTGAPTAWNWVFGDGGTSAAKSPTYAYATPGSRVVTLTACNLGCDASPAQTTINVPNQAPAADFAIASTPAAKGSVVGFDAGLSRDPDGDALTYAWDLDGNGTYTDASGKLASRTFNTAGTFTVGLKVSDGSLTDKALHTVTVLDDRPPSAGFSFAPANPAVGVGVTFTSSSSDPDGQIAKLEWDLDGDGQFDDAQGPTATWAFDAPGSHTVSLRATDDRGVSAIAFQTIDVSGPGTPAVQPTPGSAPGGAPLSPPAPSVGRPRLMSPFPIVRIRGIIVGARVRIGVLSVRAPKGATVRIHCRGRGCPVGWLTQRVRSAAHSVRFRRLEHSVRAGTSIEVFVRSATAIGKYTRFDVRAGKAPLRRDLCLPPGASRPTRCPLR